MQFQISVFVLLLSFSLGPTSTGNCAPSSSDLLHDYFEDPEPPLATRVKRIVNGTEAPPTDFPYQVAIMLITELGHLWYVCGGAIVAPNWILTAAHCVTDTDSKSPSFVVIAGTVSLAKNDLMTYDPQKQFKAVAKIHVHFEYNGLTTENDMALLWLPSALNLIPGFVEPVSVATGTEKQGKAVIAGWGQTSTTFRDPAAPIRPLLRHTSLLLFSSRFCFHLLSNNFQVEYDPDRMLCVMGDGSGVCFGDSGSPVVDSEGSLVGIVSFGLGTNETCFIDEPTYVGRVSAYIDWIQEVCSDCLTLAPEAADFNITEAFEAQSSATLAKLQDDYSFQVLITRRDADPDLEVSCTGSIIAQRWILTSWSCLEEVTNFTAVYVRPATTGIGEDLAPVVLVDWVESMKVERDFGVALLHTGMEFTWAGWTRVQLGLEDPAEGTTAELVGWAQYPLDAEHLYYTTFNITIFSGSFCSSVNLPYFEQDTMICGMEDGQVLRYCDDHLGTPVMQNGKQIGLINGYDRNEDFECFSDFPMVVSRISMYFEWIQEVCGDDCLLDPITDSASRSGTSGLNSLNSIESSRRAFWQLTAFLYGVLIICIF